MDFGNLFAAKLRMQELRRSVSAARFQESTASRLWRKVFGNKKNPLRPPDIALLNQFSTKGRQRQRAELRNAWAARVARSNPQMPRGERRKLATAYAAGEWKESRKPVGSAEDAR